MKIPLLLVQFLYKNRRLALPGIGIFTLDQSIVLPEENDTALLSLPNGVQFQNANIAAADKELITYICENTGKIRPLAISDLESFLTLGMEMLNIGKPFHLEGIGTITKKGGKLDFVPGEYALIKEGHPGTAPDHSKPKRAEPEQPSSAFRSSQNQNLLRGLAILAGLVIIGWGGYLLYKKTAVPGAENKTEAVVPQQSPAAAADSTTPAGKGDSEKINKPAAQHAAGNKDSVVYKFIILPTNNKAHALRRYRQLLSFDLRAHLYEKDSSFFKVYFQFPALSKDTVHIKDSLKRQYAHEVTIEE
ncbi:MAG TPA: hypothetical protein VGM24_07115 [Puia sp.]